MDYQQVHEPMRGVVHDISRDGRRMSPICVPVVRGDVKLIRRGRTHRRRIVIAAVGLMLLFAGAFSYAFILENGREKELRLQTP
jgi:hypothetical protein